MVNPILEVDRHPLPDTDDLLSHVAGGVTFSKLDLSRAYRWLPFGIASPPAIFQRIMEGLLNNMLGVVLHIP